MELLERFARGDLEAFEALFRQFQGEVYGWVVRIVRNRAAAEDVTVEAFWRIYRAHARFDPARSFGAWARRIATNEALDYVKTARRDVSLSESAPLATAQDLGVDPQVQRAIRRAFDALPAKLRVAATLALIEERPYEEIAEALGISADAVKVRVFRAVRKLRANLKELGVEP